MENYIKLRVLEEGFGHPIRIVNRTFWGNYKEHVKSDRSPQVLLNHFREFILPRVASLPIAEEKLKTVYLSLNLYMGQNAKMNIEETFVCRIKLHRNGRVKTWKTDQVKVEKQ